VLILLIYLFAHSESTDLFLKSRDQSVQNDLTKTGLHKKSKRSAEGVEYESQGQVPSKRGTSPLVRYARLDYARLDKA